jgi:hypothetical protein
MGKQTGEEKLTAFPVEAASQIVFSREQAPYNKNRAFAYRFSFKYFISEGIYNSIYIAQD